MAPRERSHHGRDRSMPSSVSFGASKECGGRKSPNALYRIEHGRNDLAFIISRKQIKSERKLPVGGVEVDHIIPSRGWDMHDQFFRITREVEKCETSARVYIINRPSYERVFLTCARLSDHMNVCRL